jgi:maleylacetoacetate isomerase
MKIKYYDVIGSNCSNRVKWVLNYKNIAYEIIDRESISSEEYQKINPFLRVPSMVIDGKPLTESMVMAEFLEDNFPEFPLLPPDAFERAKVREVCEIINATIHPVQNSKVPVFFHPELGKEEIIIYREKWIRENLQKLLPFLFLESNFAVGSTFSMADIFLIAIYYRGLMVGLPEDTFPALNEHIKFCMSFSDVKNSCPIPKLVKGI